MPLTGLVRFGSFELDPQSGELRHDGRRIRLQEKPFLLLMALIENPNLVVTHEELRARLWPPDTHVMFEDSLKHAVKRLRDALEDSAESPRYIETIPRRGYRFIARVEASAASVQGRPSFRLRLPHRSRIAPLVVAGLAAIIIAPIIWKRLRPAAEGPRITSLAVLPLKNLSGDLEQDYIAEGLTESLIAELARIEPLRVVSWTSALAYGNAKKRLPQIANELGVEGVVEGGVTRSGNRVRISVQLVDAATDRHVWAGSLERDMSDILSLQSDIARAIAVKIHAHTASRKRRIHKADPEAIQLYLKGRYFYNRWAAGLWKAVDHLERAVAKDPDFAEAHGLLAMCHVDLAFFGAPQKPLEKGRETALHALTLDDTTAEAWAALGGVKMFRDWNWTGAEIDFRQAVALDPSCSEARIWYSNLLTALGRFDEGLAEAHRARERDPVSILANMNVGWTLAKAHRYDEAIEEYKRTLELDPNFRTARAGLAWVYTYYGHYKQAFAEFDRAGVSEDDPHRAFLYGVAGQRSKALEIIRRRERRAMKEYVIPYFIAMPYAGLGDKKRALDWLGKALEDRSAVLFLLKVDPFWDCLRGEPRFQEYLRRMGLDD